MKTSVCFYFQVHQPYRIKPDYSFFDMGMNRSFVDDKTNCEIINKVANQCYLPTNNILLNLIKKYPSQIKICFSLSGVVIEQLKAYAPAALASFQELAHTGCVEFLAETYYHSLSSIFSKEEFLNQVVEHQKIIQSVFGLTPTIFRNTELIYSNNIAQQVLELGLKGIIIDGIDRVVKWRSPNFLYSPIEYPELLLILKNYRLSDDLAFRYPVVLKNNNKLLLDKLQQLARNGSEVIGLFMDYETFGEHHWKESGIIDYLKNLIESIVQSTTLCLASPSDVISRFRSHGSLNVPDAISWADTERDLSAWYGNPLQNSATELLYSLEKTVKASRNLNLIRSWKILTSSDHSYYTCLKNYSDGAVHNYFSPFNSPHEAFVAYSNAINFIKYNLTPN